MPLLTATSAFQIRWKMLEFSVVSPAPCPYYDTISVPCQAWYSGVTSDNWNRFCQSTTTTPQPFYGLFFWDHLGELGPEENFWTLWCKGRLTEADTPAIRMGATPSRQSSAHLHHPPFFTGRIPFLPPNQQCQITEGKRPIYKWKS